MKKIYNLLICAICIMFFSAASVSAQSFVKTYDFASVTTTSGTTDPTPVPTQTGLTFGSFSAVGVASSNTSGAGRFSFTGWPLDPTAGSLTGTIGTSIYYEVTITPTSGYTLNLDSMRIRLQRSGTGARSCAVRSSIDGYASNIAAVINPANAELTVIGGNVIQWVNDGVTTGQNGARIVFPSSYDNITTATTFRFYGWNAEAAGGTFSIDDVTFVGAVGSAGTLVTGITVTGAGGATTITTAGGTLQMNAAISPANATNQNVTWSVTDGTGHATINSTGLLTAATDGTVTVRATAQDGSGVYGELVVTLSNQNPPVLVSSITVAGAGNATTITTYHGTLQMSASVLPANATNSTYTWSVTNGTGTATINSTGLLTAATDGVVTVKATANDASGVVGTLDITLSNQTTTITSIYDIQYSTTAPYISPKNGQVVTTTGIVTGVYPTKGYYIQDANGPWHGVYVYNSTNTPALGDSIVITGTVSEYNTLTEIGSVTSYQVVASGKPQPTPSAVTASSAKNEQYEGVLVKLSNVKVTYVAASGWFRVDQGVNDTIQVGKIFYTMSPAPVVDKYYDIVGVVSFSFGRYDVNPRQASDISDATSVIDNDKNFTGVYPTATTNYTNINFGTFTDAKISIIATSGRILRTVSVKDLSTIIDFSDFASGVYIIRVENNSNRSITNYRVVKM